MEAQPETLREQYQLRFSELQEYREQVWQVLCSSYFSRFIRPDAAILDLGAGWGEFVNHIAAGRKYAMDLNPATPEHLSEGITFISQDCSQPWNMGSESLDVVFTSNFLEHLFDKPSIERTVTEAYRCLKDGGLFICMSPNMNCVPGAYWNFWDHHIPLTEQSCAELLRMKGFDIVKCLARFLPFSMSGGMKSPLFLVRLYLQLPQLWPLFGKQFLVIGKKPASLQNR
jgi:SAM-dependent methyltransferase